jgi:RimJ/RimL family protein N-acetyltransferase
MKLVTNTPQYWEFLRNLRNDERVREGFIKQEYITPERHKEHMMIRGDVFYICLIDEQPVGFVRVLNDDIGVCTHPDYQKRGVGKFMINEIMKKYPSACAKIKIENKASIGLFESCGFTRKFFLMEKSQ